MIQLNSRCPAKSRWLVVFLIWLMMLVAYMDRVNISIAVPNLAADLHLSKTQIGVILGAFSLGYALMQAPGGFLSDKFGAKPLLIAGLIAWSVFTGLTGLCSALFSFILVRFLFGLGEGLENGAQFKLIGDHFEERERSRANGLFLTSLALGPALASPVSSWLIQRVGWRDMFFVFGALGLFVAVILQLFLPKAKGNQESAHPASPNAPSVSLVSIRGVPTLLLGYCAFNIAFWGFIGWTPTYLREQRHISLTSLGAIGAIPYLCGFFGLLLVGQLGSSRLHGSRNALVAFCYAAASVALYVALTASTVIGCIVGLSFAAFFLYAAFAPFWSLALRLAAPGQRGSVTGFINFGGQIGGFVGQFSIGYLANQRHSFDGAILFMCAALLAGALLISRPDKSIAK